LQILPLRALAIHADHSWVPCVRELTSLGAMPMKRVGWFCRRDCVSAYEFRFRVILEPETSSALESHL
jgi:hypothetical protein